MVRALITIANFALGAALTKRNVADYSVLYMDEAPPAGYTFYQSGTYCSDGFIFDGKDADCTQKCSVEPSCNYYTEYSNGYCQMSSSCTNPQKALGASANTFLKATTSKKRPSQIDGRPNNSSSEAGDVFPITWLHFPKSGTSFLNVLYHHPDICPGFPAKVHIPADSELGDDVDPLNWWYKRYPPHQFCKGGLTDGGYKRSFFHYGISDEDYARYKGHLVAIFRQPEQRLISSYNYAVQKEHWCGRRHYGFGEWKWENVSLAEYASHAQGCMVKMLTRPGNVCFSLYDDSFYPEMKSGNARSRKETEKAISRLREGFAYIGLTDEWELSLCLFHAMFGGTCSPEEFNNNRANPSKKDPSAMYDTSSLEGFVDENDGRLYKAAQDVFWKNIAKYDVQKNCANSCTS